jgi:hypothetical protein
MRQRAARQNRGNGEFGLGSIDRLSHASASSSRPMWNLAIPAISIQRGARSSRGLMRKASRMCASVSSLRPEQIFAMPIYLYASAKFRSIANARLQAAMP